MPEKLVNNKNLELYIFKPFILFDPKLKTNEIGEVFSLMVIVLTELF
tara:strand:+ start:392 stop:532 length:141 start_codon:yes stop_codon:yes gene_type:complete